MRSDRGDSVAKVDDYWARRELRTWPRWSDDGRRIVYGFARRMQRDPSSAPLLVRP